VKATFRFYGPLNDFLPARQRQEDVPFEVPERPSVKDAIEALGPPHVEVAHIVVDGEPRGFDHLLADGERVSVYPEGAVVAGLPRTAPPPHRPVRFVLDTHLRRLAVYLRLLGCDVRWWAGAEDRELARVSAEESRVLLTRDLGLLKRAIVVHGRFVRATDPAEQLREVVAAFDLADEARPFTRCLRCNGEVVPVPKQEVLDRLRPGTRRGYHLFRMCTACDRVFWRGAHYGRLVRIVRAVLPEWTDPRDDDEERAMTDGGHWWETFFSGLWLEVQRHIHPPEHAQQVALRLSEFLELPAGTRILDAPCGNGRIGLPLAQLGHHVTGVDLCDKLLDEGRAIAAEQGVDVTFDHANVRDLEFDSEFDVALCWWTSLGFFDDVGNLEQARVACRALRPGGRYVIDGPLLESIVSHCQPRRWFEVDDITVTEDRTWNAETGCMDVTWTFLRGGEREVRRSSIRFYTAREMRHLLEAAGFSKVEVFANLDGEPFTLGSNRAIVVATK
jgi:uncharacterized protein with PIN domain